MANSFNLADFLASIANKWPLLNPSGAAPPVADYLVLRFGERRTEPYSTHQSAAIETLATAKP